MQDDEFEDDDYGDSYDDAYGGESDDALSDDGDSFDDTRGKPDRPQGGGLEEALFGRPQTNAPGSGDDAASRLLAGLGGLLGELGLDPGLAATPEPMPEQEADDDGGPGFADLEDGPSAADLEGEPDELNELDDLDKLGGLDDLDADLSGSDLDPDDPGESVIDGVRYDEGGDFASFEGGGEFLRGRTEGDEPPVWGRTIPLPHLSIAGTVRQPPSAGDSRANVAVTIVTPGGLITAAQAGIVRELITHEKELAERIELVFESALDEEVFPEGEEIEGFALNEVLVLDPDQSDGMQLFVPLDVETEREEPFAVLLSVSDSSDTDAVDDRWTDRTWTEVIGGSEADEIDHDADDEDDPLDDEDDPDDDDMDRYWRGVGDDED